MLVYDYDGDSLSSKVRIFNGTGEAFNGSDYVFIEWYAVDYGNGETEISYEEYERLVNQYIPDYNKI